MGFFKDILKSASPIASAIVDAIDSNQSKEYADDSITTFEEIFEQVCKLADDDEYDEALELLEMAKSEQLLESDSDFWLFYYKKAQILYWKGLYIVQGLESSDSNYDECHNEKASLTRQASLNLEQASNFAETKIQECAILALRADTDYNANKGGSRRFFIGALGTDDEELKADYLEQYEKYTQSMKGWFEDYRKTKDEWRQEFVESLDSEEEIEEYITLSQEFAKETQFTSYPYADRQFIFIGKDIKHLGGCFDESNNINWLFTQDYIPSDIVFPAGPPQVNTLYIANPVRSNEYLPYEGAAYTLFLDKIRELRYLLQCLGATEITFECIKGHDVSMTNSLSMNLEANASVKVYKGSGGFSNNMNGKYSSNERNRMAVTQSFEPSQKPYCPENLSWLDFDNEWKTLVKQRLEGNMLNYEQVISTKSVVHMSNNQVIDVKAAFENFMVQVSGNYQQTTDSTFDESQETEWKISAVFKSLNDFNSEKEEKSINFMDALSSKVVASLSDEEEKYKEEILFCLEEDGKISDDDRRYLERKRVKFGISVERASEIEQELLPSYTEEELEYIETYKEIVGNGEVTPRQRRMLDRERDSLGISVERCVELEKNIK